MCIYNLSDVGRAFYLVYSVVWYLYGCSRGELILVRVCIHYTQLILGIYFPQPRQRGDQLIFLLSTQRSPTVGIRKKAIAYVVVLCI